MASVRVGNVARSLLQTLRGQHMVFRASAMSTNEVANKTQDLVETEQRGDIFMIAINRPAKRNCVNSATAAQLIQAFQSFERETKAKVAVLYGKEGVFCAGYDLSTVTADNQSIAKEPVQGIEAPMGPTRMLVSKPVIAAVQGYAVAGGLELALLCDLRVVEESVIMGVFCRRFGVPLLDGGTIRLPKLIGLSRALDMILTGRPIRAKEALEFGLANRVVPNGAGVEEAVRLAKEIASFPQECMKMDRKSAYYSQYDAKNTIDAFQYEYENGSSVLTIESVVGAKSFIDGTGKHGEFSPFTKSKL